MSWSARLQSVVFGAAVVLAKVVMATAAAGTISGQVADVMGTPIAGAEVLFHYDSSGQIATATREDVKRTTDADGRFEVHLDPGLYDVCVMAMAFRPTCRKVQVKEQETLHHDVKLAVDLGPDVAARPSYTEPRYGPGRLIRGNDGTVMCQGFTGSSTELVVQVREPLALSAQALSQLPPDRRDLSTLPIHVALLSPERSSMPEGRPPSRFDATLEHVLIDGKMSTEKFVFTVFPIDWIIAGTTIVAERVATASNGLRVVVQTRCPITDADVAFWRQKELRQ